MRGESKSRALTGKPQHLGDLKEDASPLAPGLYIVATPIGNARDITLRALEVLKGVDLIAAEDTRVTAKLMAIHGLSKPLLPYNDHNAARERPRILERLRAGGRIALVSDAGTPLVSDPGFKLARAAIEDRLPVHAVPGASAVLTGLVLSGLPSDRFLFAGFLPAKRGGRRSALEALKSVSATLIFFESGPRLAESLNDMAAILGARKAAVAREMTKLHEEIKRGPLAALAEDYASETAPKGEVTVLVSGAEGGEADLAQVDRALDTACRFMPLKPAAQMVADLTGLSRNRVYARGLERLGKTNG
jgi:16S rRNA (cytidine1402-2'-O)-methyltransferase